MGVETLALIGAGASAAGGIGSLATSFGSKPSLTPIAGPDPFTLGNRQLDFSNPNFTSPFGSIENGFVNGKFTQTVKETPFQKDLREVLEPGTLDFAKAFLGEGIDLYDRARPQDVDDVRQTMFDKSLGLATEYFDDRRQERDAELLNRGIPIGSEAYLDGMEPLMQSQDDAIARLALDSFRFGGDEQSRLFGLDSAARGQDFGEFANFFGSHGFTPSPLVQAGGARGVDVTGTANSNFGSLVNQRIAQQQFKQGATQQQQGGFGGLMDIGGMLAGLGGGGSGGGAGFMSALSK